MPELNQLLDGLVAEVKAGTRAPGAAAAITQSRRRRRKLAASSAAGMVVAVAALWGSGMLPGTLSEAERDLQPAPAPSVSSEPSTGRDAAFASLLRRLVSDVPDWSIDDSQPQFTGTSCAGDWSSEATGGGAGTFDVSTNGVHGQVWHARLGFGSPAAASAAVDALVENLESCAAVDWQGQEVNGTEVVLLSSADGLIWVCQLGNQLSFLEAATSDGPPPIDVQVAIADLMSSDMTW